jgi:16S rRNA (guanine1207-N2)-methyltransferase
VTPAARALSHAFDTATLAPPPAGARAFFLRAQAPLLDWKARIDAEQSYKPAYDRLRAAGWSVAPQLAAGEQWPLGLVLLTKHKEESFANIARGWAMLAPGGRLVCAGGNDDGAASLQRHADKALGLDDSLSKFHCRVFWLTKSERAPPDYWQQLTEPRPVAEGGWISQPGLFSWDRIDAGSLLLAAHLPNDLADTVADFGCGWGFLSREVLARCPGVTRLDLIDAEHHALEAARQNIADPRAAFHWLDLVTEVAPALYDAIVCNPPFHAGRAAEPALGQGFIEAAAKALKVGGRLFLVANRGLPYEPLLRNRFAAVEMLTDNNKFRVWRAVR